MISIFGSNFCPNCASSRSGQHTDRRAGSSHADVSDLAPLHSGILPRLRPRLRSPPARLLLHSRKTPMGRHLPTAKPPPMRHCCLPLTGKLICWCERSSDSASPLTSLSTTRLPAVQRNRARSNTVNIVATDPGIFTIGADGQGNGAILDLNNNLISSTNPAGLRSTTVTGNSDIVSIYMTGLGIPDSTGDNTQTGGGLVGRLCQPIHLPHFVQCSADRYRDRHA